MAPSVVADRKEKRQRLTQGHVVGSRQHQGEALPPAASQPQRCLLELAAWAEMLRLPAGQHSDL